MKYEVKIIEGKFDKSSIDQLDTQKNYEIIPRKDTVEVTFYENGKVKEINKYGLVTKEEIFKLINEGKEINLNHCYIEDFSIREFKKKYPNSMSIDEEEIVLIKKFSAQSAFFNLSKKCSVDFSCAKFVEGKVDFDYAKFRKGNVDFTCAEFEKCDVNFSNVKFGEGNVNFNGTKFREGNVYFVYAKFGEGDVNFLETKIGEGSIYFNSTDFGKGKVYFSTVRFKCDILKFFFSESEKIIFHNCVFEKDVVMSAFKCNILVIENCTIKQTFELNNKIYSVKALGLYETKNLGQIFIDWEDDNVKRSISTEFNTVIDVKQVGRKRDFLKKANYKEKAYQYRLLKENFNILGQYEDEDKAYLEFKRCEMKSKIYDNEKIPQRVIRKTETSRRFFKHYLEQITYIIDWIKFFSSRPLKSLSYFLKLIIFDWTGGFGTKPRNVFKAMIAVIAFFSLFYLFVPFVEFNIDSPNNVHIMSCNNSATSTYNISTQEVGNITKFFDSFYYSGITFLTIGYGDISPANHFTQVASVFEGFIGIFLMSYFTVSFVRKLLR